MERNPKNGWQDVGKETLLPSKQWKCTKGFLHGGLVRHVMDVVLLHQYSRSVKHLVGMQLQARQTCCFAVHAVVLEAVMYEAFVSYGKHCISLRKVSCWSRVLCMEGSNKS